MVDDPDGAAALDGSNPDPADAPAELRRTFWSIVFLLNVTLLATSIGVMLIVFEGRVSIGVSGIALGVGTGIIALWRYTKIRRAGERNA